MTTFAICFVAVVAAIACCLCCLMVVDSRIQIAAQSTKAAIERERLEALLREAQDAVKAAVAHTQRVQNIEATLAQHDQRIAAAGMRRG